MLALFLWGCSGTTDPEDSVPPFDVQDLRTVKVSDTFVSLAWTAPGDDSRTGTATSYDVRYSTEPLTEATWANATRASSPPSPQVAGRTETIRIEGLTRSTRYYVALKTLDEASNASEISNVPEVTTADIPIAFVLAWGSFGEGVGMFRFPRGVAVDTDGHVLVSDERNDRVQVFRPDGTFETGWGMNGTGPGAFQGPFGIAAINQHVFVVDAYNDRVQRFSQDGDFELELGDRTNQDPGLSSPWGIALSTNGNVYVADAGNERIAVYSTAGALLSVWTDPDALGWEPSGVEMGSGGSVYVTDIKNHRVLRMASTGAKEISWGGIGEEPGLFNTPADAALDARGSLHVVDSENHRVQVFDADGAFLFQYGGRGSGPGQFEHPFAVAASTMGEIFVADADNHRVQVFAYP